MSIPAVIHAHQAIIVYGYWELTSLLKYLFCVFILVRDGGFLGLDVCSIQVLDAGVSTRRAQPYSDACTRLYVLRAHSVIGIVKVKCWVPRLRRSPLRILELD